MLDEVDSGVNFLEARKCKHNVNSEDQSNSINYFLSF